MNGGIVPLLLVGLSVGLMLGFVPSRAATIALLAFFGAAVLGLLVPLPVPETVLFTGLWASTIAVAAMTFLPFARRPATVLILGFIGGFMMGKSAALGGDHRGFALGLVTVLVCYPAKWLATRKLDIVIKVVASWMIAIASLSMFVSLMATPGYKPDHME